MPVHSPSGRLLSSVPFKHLAQTEGRSREVNAHLNVTPFVDMMTILVCFLLMVFSATGELITSQRGLRLPDATNRNRLRKAPVLIVTRDTITFQGEQMATVQSVEQNSAMEWKIPQLFDRLKRENTEFQMSFSSLPTKEKENCARAARGIRPKRPEDICLKGLLILQADRSTPIKVLNRVLKTAYAAQYKNIMFAVDLRAHH